MALLNPVYGLIVPFLFIVTVPLAILAGITTTLAFSLLIFRAGLVYIDIVVNMVPQYIAGRPVYPLFGNRGSYLNTGAGGGATTTTVSSIPATTSSTTTPSLQQASPVSMSSSTGGLGHHAPGGSSPTAPRQQQVVVARNNHRRRRASAASFISMGGGSSTPTDEASNNNHNHNNSNNNINNDNGIGGVGGGGGSSKRSSFMMPSSVGMDRDFEGVGGWRLNGKPANEGDGDDDDDDDDDDDAWTHINSRLSLPLMDPLWRHHHRSPSGAGTVTPGGGGGGNGGGGEYLMMMRSPSSGLASEERLYEHGSGGKRGRERRGEKDGAVPRTGGVSPNRSRVRTPTRMLPPLTSVDGTDGSYFPRVVSPRAEKRSI